MRLSDLVAMAGLKLICSPPDPGTEVVRVYAADTMSELIAHAASGTLLVTHLDHAQLARVAELMDAPAICLADGAQPGDGLIDAARRAGTALLVSPSGIAKTVRALEERLAP